MASDNPPAPPSMSRVSPSTIRKAVNALLKWREIQSENQKPQLLPADEFIYLILTLKKIPPKESHRTNPHKIPLRHPIHHPNSSSELCLIIDDRPNSKLTSETAKKKIKSEDIPISKVLKLSKLKSDYKPFEAKRKLCDSYDLFFVDKRVVPLLPKLLGKQFFKKKKLPLPVDLTHKNWKEQIDRACSSALVHMKKGTCSVARVGKMSMESGEIVENVSCLIDGVVEIVPKKWGGVRSLHLKLSESLALPIYQAVPDMKLKIDGIKANVEEVKEKSGGELEVIEGGKKDGKLGKKKGAKKGRIHEVQYMDEDEVGIDDDDDEDDNEGEKKSENGDLGSAEFVGKERKKGDSMKGLVLSELNGEKTANKIGNVEKGGSYDGNVDNESEKSENDDLGSAEFVGKKRKKGDSAKGRVLSKKAGEKRVKKMIKKGDDEEQRRGGSALKGVEDSGGKKGKKSDVKVKKSKKQQYAE